ncbi:hypothetical protein NDU88_003215 [Pleurodeles waltl]|uniref:Uncharacterized protein n=1 Tax=Pleurodeles waltl TaxID=8319 RepID=A0AAV7UDG0_PLEWA|nr:hypothetical protein NDU88_003215 [Pleurodeles waltl]
MPGFPTGSRKDHGDRNQNIGGCGLTTLQQKVTTLMAISTKLATRVENLEGHTFRNNLRFVGFLERCKGTYMDALGYVLSDPREVDQSFASYYEALYALRGSLSPDQIL